MGSITEWMESRRPTIIFGAGRQAGHIYEYCKLYGKKCLAIMTSADKTRKGLLPDEAVIPHAFPDTWVGDRSTVDIIIALGGGTREVYDTLVKKGYDNVYYSENWMEGNEILRAGRTTGYIFCDELADMHMHIQGRIYDKTAKYMKFCCNSVANPPAIAFSDTPEETFDHFLGLRERCVSEYVTNRDIYDAEPQNYGCLSCVKYCEKSHLWHQSSMIKFVSLNPLPSPCQCNCIYCDKETYSWKESPEVRAAYKRMFEVLEYGKKSGLIWRHAKWQIAPGEITVHPFREEFMNLVHDQNAQFLTNAFLFDKDIAQNLHSNTNSRIDISLDSGTGKTWKKIKGIDNFEKVKSNLERYAENCCDPGYQIILKYIVLPGINDNDEDYKEFVHFMKHIGAKFFYLARDLRKNEAPIEEKTKIWDAGAKLMGYCRANGLETHYDIYSLKERNEIEERTSNILNSQGESLIVD